MRAWLLVTGAGMDGQMPYGATGRLTPFLIPRRPGGRRKRIFALLVIGVASTDDVVIVRP